jgi:hypothetical protein
VEVHEFQHQDRVFILLREGALNRRAEEIKEWFLAGRFFRLCPSFEEIFRRIGSAGHIDAKTLAPFQIHQSVRGYGEQPRLQRTTALVFCQKDLAISARGEAIGPKIRDEVLGLGLVGAARAQDTDELAVVPASQFRGSRRLRSQDALDEGKILFMARRSFDGHKGKKDGVPGLERQSF